LVKIDNTQIKLGIEAPKDEKKEGQIPLTACGKQVYSSISNQISQNHL